MIAATITIKAYFHQEDLPSVYSNEDLFREALVEHLSYALDKLDARDVTIHPIDLEGMA